MFQSAGHTVAPRLVADVPVLTPNQFLNRWYCVVRSDQTAGKITREHRNVIEMIAGGKGVLALDSELSPNFCQSRPFVERRMAEPGVNVVSHNRQIGHAGRVGFQKSLDRVRIM